MELSEVMRTRHSVRQYADKAIEMDILNILQNESTPAIRRGICTFSWYRTSRKPLTALWPITENSKG